MRRAGIPREDTQTVDEDHYPISGSAMIISASRDLPHDERCRPADIQHHENHLPNVLGNPCLPTARARRPLRYSDPPLTCRIQIGTLTIRIGN